MTLPPSSLLIGNAPISYGVFGATAGLQETEPVEMLFEVASAGYRGCELGPPGFFGDPPAVAERFASAQLAAIGAYVPIHFTAGQDTVDADLAGLRASAAELAASGGGLLILADEGSAALLSAPGHDPDDAALTLDNDAWSRLSTITAQAVAIAADYGLSTSFHPHISTYVEHPREIETLLERTEVMLTLDTGHLLLAGGDPTDCLRRWRERVNHVHLKDVVLAVFAAAKRETCADFDSWWEQVCVPFGAGDVDLNGFIEDLLGGGYDGWLVVEQDRGPATAADAALIVAQQRANLEFVIAAAGRVAPAAGQHPGIAKR
jgi:inosose dehydratase